MRSIDSIRLALFGESDVGKTHYGGQLLTRIETEACELKMREAPIDLSPFEEVRQKLSKGLLASHTASNVYKESVWPVTNPQHGIDLDLIWPDYAGEQVRQLIDMRLMGKEWLSRVQSADGWVLMVRPKLARQDDDIFSRPLGNVPRPESDAGHKPARSVQARLVELLQMLVHARSLDRNKPLPPLTVLLSCWDEVNPDAGIKPADILWKCMPLVASYVLSRWGDNKQTVFGLSALGVELSRETANAQYADKGPEHFGFVITPDGSRSTDLTLPIMQLAEVAKRQ